MYLIISQFALSPAELRNLQPLKKEIDLFLETYKTNGTRRRLLSVRWTTVNHPSIVNLISPPKVPW